MMEANISDVNCLDSDVLLPPRKRLLACMKKQNCDVNGNSYSPSTSSSLNELDTRLSNLLRAHLSNANPSQMEVLEASRSAAEVAMRIAVAARAAAEEKAVIAAAAMAAAKKALELVAIVDDETLSSTEQQLKKNKTKKHVQVQLLYDNLKPRGDNGKASDEELARKLHQAINSSPRILKYGLSSNLKSHKHKRLKSLSISENGSVVGEGNSPSISNGSSITCQRVAYIGEVDENTSNINHPDMSRMDNEDAEGIRRKEKFGEQDTSRHGRNRGRMEQKKLPLSMYHDTDTKDKPLFSVGPSADSDAH